MRAMLLVLQVLVSLIVTAVAMPVVLANVPAARSRTLGLTILGGLFLLSFVVVRLLWPRRRA